MPKGRNSWSVPEIPGIIARKKVDWSVFEYGTHIPQELHSYFEKANENIHIERGHSHELTLVIEDKEFKATLININLSKFDKDTLHIRYDSNKELKNFLQEKFRSSYDYIVQIKSKVPEDKKPSIIVPDEHAEYIDFFKTETPFQYKMVLNYNNEPIQMYNQTSIFELDEAINSKEDNPIINENTNKFSIIKSLINKPKYTLEQCAKETGVEIDLLVKWINAINRKGQAIIYGPPGTGKTYIAEHLARHLISESPGCMDIIQFHPAYSYEDFIQGIRPKVVKDVLTYPTKPGRFLEFCENAIDTKGICVLIIDEINRANLSRVFGELMYLLEYREKTIPLAGGGMFSIPQNVRIIGTMNTADRSIALVDHALRRRFAFLQLKPNFNVLINYHKDSTFPINKLVETLELINKKINDEHYQIGISFFMRKDITECIEDIWQMEIEPYLEEYFFDQLNQINEFRWDKVKEKLI